MYFYNSLILAAVVVVSYLYWIHKSWQKFFEKNGIPYINLNFQNRILGDLKDVFLIRKSLIEVYKEIYDKLEPYKLGGITALHEGFILIRDPDLIKKIIIKDFNNFQNRGISIHEELEPLSNNLFNMEGETWKNLRGKLTSTFTTGRMKIMFPLIKDCADRLHNVLQNTNHNNNLEIKGLVARFTVDTIGTCAFGVETDCLNNADSEFRKMGKRIFNFRLSFILRGLWPSLPKNVIKTLNLRFVDKDVSNYFINLIEKTIEYREKNNITRNDFLDLMISLKNKTDKFGDDKDCKKDLQDFQSQVGNKIDQNINLTIPLIAAQAFVFFTAGFDPTATTMSFVLLELARNEEIQDKARKEIKSVLEKNNGQFTYESLKEMKYVEMILEETLRKYPPAGILQRKCLKTYKIPDSNAVIPADTHVIISVMGLHMDPKFYERPNEFYPEHFTEEAKSKRPHFTYMPFGDGPRACIAERFARMQVKIGLISLIRDFKWEVSPKMKFPIEFVKNFGLLQVKNGIWVNCQKI